MAPITAARKTSDFSGFLQPHEAEPYFEEAARNSVVQQLVRRVPLGINGERVPVVTGKMTAGWVAEGAKKPASEAALDLKSMQPEKIAAIAVVSAEVVRANPGNYMNLIRTQIAEAFALAFDAATLHGTNTPFGANSYLDATTKSVELGTATQNTGGIHADLVAGMQMLVDDSKRLTGFALDDRVEPRLLGATDNTGRPLYIDTPLADTTAAARPGRLLGRSSFMAEGVGEPGDTSPYVLGYGGDWRQAVWGAVGGISFDVSTEATVTINDTLVSLWEQNLVAVRAEAEYGWLLNDAEAFVKYTETDES